MKKRCVFLLITLLQSNEKLATIFATLQKNREIVALEEVFPPN